MVTVKCDRCERSEPSRTRVERGVACAMCRTYDGSIARRTADDDTCSRVAEEAFSTVSPSGTLRSRIDRVETCGASVVALPRNSRVHFLLCPLATHAVLAHFLKGYWLPLSSAANPSHAACPFCFGDLPAVCTPHHTHPCYERAAPSLERSRLPRKYLMLRRRMPTDAPPRQQALALRLVVSVLPI